jgi:hypothetical protein
MTTDRNNQSGSAMQEQNEQTNNEKASQISLPKIERPEGPFEHSGETSGWTDEEKREKEEKEQR